MAETFLFNITERVLEKLVHLSVEEARLALNVETDLMKLKETMISIKAVLLDAERQQHHNEKLRLCMWKLKDIFYDAEDVLDDFKCEALRKQVAIPPHISFKERFLSSCSLPLAFSFKMSHKIKEINQRLDELKAEWNSFQLREGIENRHVIHRETHSFVDSSNVIGRDEDKENIISLLMKPGDGRNIPVIPIVGIGGLGKTTLAQLVYNDDRVTRSFPLKIWICVSDEFDLSRLLKLIIKSINKEEKCDDLALEVLQTCLRSLLNDNKFLLVLDDVWNEDQGRWIGLRDLLRSTCGSSSQSKIVVTTRSLKVASIMSSIRPYELKGLHLEDCLILFTKWAFHDADQRQHPNLMRVGVDIVKKCRGVPLAVRTLGSILFSKTDETDWISIRDSEIWRVQQSENDILPVLKLSYYHLPSHLQRCLALLSLFRKDHEYLRDEVIHLWMANGLLEHPAEEQDWEKVGDRYLNELLSRCLIEKEEDKNRDNFTFRMHDLIHDLALDVSQKECKTVTCQTEIVDKIVRHLSFDDDALLTVPEDLKKLKHVRTVIVQKVSNGSKNFEESLINICASNFKYLRALHLQNLYLGALLKSICTLKHLRDLDLSGSEIDKLPRSFYKLRSLQRLSMYGIVLRQLPRSIQSLIELRYLEISIGAEQLKEIRPGCWPSLRYLGLFQCDNLECLPQGMQYLTSLRRLVLHCRNLVSLPRSLKFLSKLEDLCLSGCWRINLKMEPEEEEDKDFRFSLKTFSSWASHELTDLPRLLLEGSSSTLQQISIISSQKLAVLPAWLQNLTSLRKLVIIDCPKLSTLPEGMDRLTELRQLIIEGCPELTRRYKRDGGADWHKISHIEEVVITDDYITHKI